MNAKKWPELPPLVEVLWEDHFSMGDDWHEPDHVHPPCILSAVGYLVHQDDLYYYVACTYEMDSGRYSAGTAVLKNCVVGYREYTGKGGVNESFRGTQKTSTKPINLERKPRQKSM